MYMSLIAILNNEHADSRQGDIFQPSINHIGLRTCWFNFFLLKHEIKLPVPQLVRYTIYIESWTPGGEMLGSRRSGAQYSRVLTISGWFKQACQLDGMGRARL